MATAAYEFLRPGTAEIPVTGDTLVSQSFDLPRQVASERPTLEPAQVRTAVPVLIVGPLPPARPEHVSLGTLKDPQYRLRKPIPLDVSIQESEVVVTWSEIDEFGHGETTGAAVDDFGQTLRELHRQLYAPEAHLGADLQRVKQVLGEYIEPRAK